MKILIVANHYAVASGRYAADAFQRLGHRVNTIGPAMGRNIWGLEVPAEYVWEPDENVSMTPDMVVCMDSDPYILDTVCETWYITPTVVWGVDNHVRDYRRDTFKHYFLAHRNVSVMEWRDDMTHLPCCYDPAGHVPSSHTPSYIPWEEREYDVAMIGVMYPQRWQIVQQLRDAGLKVLAGCGLVYGAYRDAYHNSRVSLCISSNGDVAQRVMETARMGCAVVSDLCADFKLLKPEGIYLVEDGDYLGAVQDVLRDADVAQAMIERSSRWAEPYSWDNAAGKVVEWFNNRI